MKLYKFVWNKSKPAQLKKMNRVGFAEKNLFLLVVDKGKAEFCKANLGSRKML